jgi:hypothetical protein
MCLNRGRGQAALGDRGSSHTLEDADGGREVVDTAGGFQGGGDDLGRGDEIVGEGVVEVALWWWKRRG